jgi:murein DD-endopeptidase MepM/ murein hydrolase activator NlpD
VLVDCGAAVAQGAHLGTAGSTGEAPGALLHFELRHGRKGRVNPWLYLT